MFLENRGVGGTEYAEYIVRLETKILMLDLSVKFCQFSLHPNWQILDADQNLPVWIWTILIWTKTVQLQTWF